MGASLLSEQRTRSAFPIATLIGDFKNPGRRWCKQADAVLVQDWPQDATGQAIPYGTYERTRNKGFVRVDDHFDTPRFAVDATRDWWESDGRRQSPKRRGF